MLWEELFREAVATPLTAGDRRKLVRIHLETALDAVESSDFKAALLYVGDALRHLRALQHNTQ